MYIVSVLMLLFVLPLGSIAVDHMYTGGPWLILLGKWFVFWAAGIRLFLAGLRQMLRPEFTAQEIFGLLDPDALPIVQELGIANLAAGTVAILSLAMPGFVLPAAVGATIFYGGAGIRHALHGHRNANRSVAMATDLCIALVFAFYVYERFASRVM